jgi:hypothetical protein
MWLVRLVLIISFNQIASHCSAQFREVLDSRHFEFIDGVPVLVSRPTPDQDVWGVEFEIITRPYTGLELRSAGTIIADLEAPAGAQAGQRYDGVTPAVVDFEAAYEVYENTRLLFDWHYVGERFSDPDLEIKLPDYTYINLGASYKFVDSGLTVAARVLSLTQSQGLEEGDPRSDPTRPGTATFFNARPLLPRRITLEARYDF